MVKTFDMERTDVTVIVLEKLGKLRNQGSLLATPVILRTLQECIKDRLPYIEQAGGLSFMPSIVLKSRCKDKSRYSREWRNFEYLPAEYDFKNHSINLCTDHIRHPDKIKENFVRELIVGTYPPAMGLSPEENLARACYQGCKESLSSYTKDQKALESMVSICTKHLFKVTEVH